MAGEDTPCWPGTRRHERLKACASHAAARCWRHDSVASPRQAAVDRRVRCRRNTGLAQHAQTVQLAGRLDDTGQHQLAEHLVPAHGLLEPEHPAGMDQGTRQMSHPRRRDRQRATRPARGMAAASPDPDRTRPCRPSDDTERRLSIPPTRRRQAPTRDARYPRTTPRRVHDLHRRRSRRRLHLAHVGGYRPTLIRASDYCSAQISPSPDHEPQVNPTIGIQDPRSSPKPGH